LGKLFSTGWKRKARDANGKIINEEKETKLEVKSVHVEQVTKTVTATPTV